MTIRIEVSEAQKELSKLIDRALTGEEVQICRDGEPVAYFSPVESEEA